MRARGAADNCSSLDRLRNIGEQPTLEAIQNPTTRAGYKPVQMPMPAPQPAIYQPNSLWRTGSRAFFKDQRANQVGDILTVQIKITDRAQFENETQRSRSQQGELRRRQLHRLQGDQPDVRHLRRRSAS